MWGYIQILLVFVSIIALVYIFVNNNRRKKNQKIFSFLLTFFICLILVFFIFYLLIFNLFNIFVPDSSSGNLINLDNNCSIAAISTGDYEERIYLSSGDIFAVKRDPKKEYHIVSHTLHYNFEQFARIICFDTVEDAKEAGYTESEYSKDMRENPLY